METVTQVASPKQTNVPMYEAFPCTLKAHRRKWESSARAHALGVLVLAQAVRPSWTASASSASFSRLLETAGAKTAPETTAAPECNPECGRSDGQMPGNLKGITDGHHAGKPPFIFKAAAETGDEAAAAIPAQPGPP